ncbi:MAG: response regulator [Gemmatimonadales bacterium]
MSGVDRLVIVQARRSPVPREPERSAPLAESAKRQKRILLVEDDEAIRDSLAELLQSDGYAVAAVDNGLAALEKLRWGMRPSLILLDLRMPVMTGWEFRAELQKVPVLADIPVVAMTTGRWKPDDLKQFAEQVEKPLNLEALRAVVSRYCRT